MPLPTDPFGTQAYPAPHAILDSLAGAAAGPAFVAAGWSVDARMPRAGLAIRDLAFMSAPARLVLSFGRPVDAGLFEGHYQVRHLSLVLAMPLVASVESALVAGTRSGRRATYHWVTSITFTSVIDMVRCLSSRAGQAALADVATFATGGATARIVISAPGRREQQRDPAIKTENAPGNTSPLLRDLEHPLRDSPSTDGRRRPHRS